ncbi:ATP-binding cassette domain-containing protein [Actinoplanes derwentensis]|uniref:ABC-2 type transport system ATP-binding protein n=1 Tax=Actinoplanes derwentensis TaxID=113562 RepID=A0A1H1TAS6_9ACTN|nr:ATP-binding cassette domain-containing protein [Actinoplanes derwentensis]GID89474.1 multidrug ABC transporter ATP-binding protein [Actinoplanes derwentensis]SDS57310.1 ABC-2 type transport system ATP-binding protein [Actinoplanes derwentensis]
MIELHELTKRYGDRTAVDQVTVTVPSGKVTALLGPNGAGKSTAMRMVLGLDRPTSGTAMIDGRRYAELRNPLRLVGAHLDARAFHPRRTGRAGRRALARYNGFPRARVETAIDAVGIGTVAGKRAGTYSLGMAQRLGIAGAMLGDPSTIILDEPVNGLDADGVRWVRGLVRRWAGDGRTVLVSSHLMSEVALIADRVVVLGRGRLLADATVAEFTAGQHAAVEVAAADDNSFRLLAVALGDHGEQIGADRLRVHGLPAATVGHRAQQAGAVLRELRTDAPSLEDAYVRLVEDEAEYVAVAA